jgi:hypothetical protein
VANPPYLRRSRIDFSDSLPERQKRKHTSCPSCKSCRICFPFLSWSRDAFEKRRKQIVDWALELVERNETKKISHAELAKSAEGLLGSFGFVGLLTLFVSGWDL